MEALVFFRFDSWTFLDFNVTADRERNGIFRLPPPPGHFLLLRCVYTVRRTVLTLRNKFLLSASFFCIMYVLWTHFMPDNWIAFFLPYLVTRDLLQSRTSKDISFSLSNGIVNVWNKLRSNCNRGETMKSGSVKTITFQVYLNFKSNRVLFPRLGSVASVLLGRAIPRWNISTSQRHVPNASNKKWFWKCALKISFV